MRSGQTAPLRLGFRCFSAENSKNPEYLLAGAKQVKRLYTRALVQKQSNIFLNLLSVLRGPDGQFKADKSRQKPTKTDLTMRTKLTLRLAIAKLERNALKESVEPALYEKSTH